MILFVLVFAYVVVAILMYAGARQLESDTGSAVLAGILWPVTAVLFIIACMAELVDAWVNR